MESILLTACFGIIGLGCLTLIIIILLTLIEAYNDTYTYKPFKYDYVDKEIIFDKDKESEYHIRKYWSLGFFKMHVKLKDGKKKIVEVHNPNCGDILQPSVWLTPNTTVITDFKNNNTPIDFEDIISFRPYDISWSRFIDRYCDVHLKTK